MPKTRQCYCMLKPRIWIVRKYPTKLWINLPNFNYFIFILNSNTVQWFEIITETITTEKSQTSFNLNFKKKVLQQENEYLKLVWVKCKSSNYGKFWNTKTKSGKTRSAIKNSPIIIQSYLDNTSAYNIFNVLNFVVINAVQ